MRGNISAREREILILASQGYTDKAIATELGVSARTIGTYWERLRGKTNGLSRAHMVMQVLGKELELAAEEARRAIEARNTLLEQAEDYAVFGIDLEGKLTGWNIGVYRLLGYQESEFNGKPFSLIFTPEDVASEGPSTELKEARAKGRYLERRYHLRKDGKKIWVDGTLVAIYDQAGAVISFSKIMRNDQERKSLEEEVQRLQKQSK